MEDHILVRPDRSFSIYLVLFRYFTGFFGRLSSIKIPLLCSLDCMETAQRVKPGYPILTTFKIK